MGIGYLDPEIHSVYWGARAIWLQGDIFRPQAERFLFVIVLKVYFCHRWGGRIGIYSASKCGQVAAEVLQGLQLGQGPSGSSAREPSG